MAARRRNIVQALHFLRATTGRRCWITNGMAPGTAGHDYGFDHWDVQVGILLGKARAAQGAPRGPQEAPKGPQEAPKRPSIFVPEIPPKCPPEDPESAPKIPQSFCDHDTTIRSQNAEQLRENGWLCSRTTTTTTTPKRGRSASAGAGRWRPGLREVTRRGTSMGQLTASAPYAGSDRSCAGAAS